MAASTAQVPAAPSADELRERLAGAEAEAGELRESLAAARERMFTAEAEAERAAAKLAGAERELAEGSSRRAALAEGVRRAEKRLADEKQRLNRARGLLAERLRAIYMNGTIGTHEVAISARDFDHLLVGAEYLAAIQEADARLAERVEEIRSDIALRLQELREQHRQARRHEAKLASIREQMGAISATAQSRLAEARQAAAQRDAALDELLSRLADWKRQVERAERREAKEAESASAGSAGETVERWLGGPYSIPTAIVMCESGGNYSALNPSSGAGGAYQIMPSTWAAYGGKGLPHQASKAEQDRIAALIWADSGPSAWVCKA